MKRSGKSARGWCLAAGAAATLACQSPETAAFVTEEDEPPARVETLWTAMHEWFVEHPLLVQGTSAELAAHLTSLADFRAIELGSLEVALLDGSGAPRQRVVADAVARSGIFLPEITPDWSGNGRLTLTYRAPTGATDQVGWDVRVAPSATDLAEAPPELDGIGFLKEQQWRIPFATEAVTSRPIRNTIVRPATIESHERFTAIIVPPGPGIFRAPETGLPGPGASVRSGETLGYLWPSPGVAADWSSLRSDLVTARNDAVEAQHEHDRAERLVAAGAVPARRLVEALTALENAGARLRSVEARAAVLEGLGAGSSESVALPIVAPMSGIVVRVAVTDGEPVDAEHWLYRIVDLDRLVVRVELPEPDLLRLIEARSVRSTIEVRVRPAGTSASGPGLGEWIAAGALLDFGSEIDPATRTAPLRYEVQGVGERFRPGMSAEAQVHVGAPREALTVPARSLIDLAGVSVVYVQLGGETFAERVVRTGVVDGDAIEIVSGLSIGERIVTIGAYQVRLAALSPDAAPAHSH